jgi:hypothetical protein
MKISLPLLLCCALLPGSTNTLQAETTASAPKKKAPAFVIPPDINGLKTIITPPEKTKPIKVAIFDGKGAPVSGIDNVEGRIKSLPQATVTRVPADEWGTIDLKAFDVVVFSGGSGSVQAAAIGEKGRENVREYVRGGGGYLGVCAGAYLACSNFSWGLGILNAGTVSSKWQRGQGFMDIEVTDEGRKLLGDVKGTFKVRYHNGPIIKPAGRTDVPAYTPVAFFRSEIAEYGSPAGVMVNSPSQAMGTFGKGRVFISSPHPENTPGLENFIPRAVLWAGGADPSPNAFVAVLTASFPGWDRDRDGTLSMAEIDQALADPIVQGDAAAALAVVKRLARGKTWAAIPRTLPELSQLASGAKTKDGPDIAKMFTEGQKHIAQTKRELFAEGAPGLTSLCQGAMGNCFSLAPLGSMLSRDPVQVKKMFTQNGDGTYEVAIGDKPVRIAAPTDAEIALSSSSESTGLWSNVYEKAVGTARNELREEKDRVTTPLDAIARGGSAGTMLAFVTGHPMQRFTLKWAKDPATTSEESEAKLKELRTKLVSAFAEHRCVTTGTLKPTLPGLRGGHAYGVIGYDEATDAIRTWDPHGDSFQPKGAPGPETGFPRKDGVCDMPLSVFAKQFSGLAFELPPGSQGDK